MKSEINLIEAKELLLNKVFIQKGNKFQNKVTDVTFDEIKQCIVVGYKTLNSDKVTSPNMELNQFIGNHII